MSPTLQQATTDPHLQWRLLDTHRQVWVSFFGGHWSFLQGPGAHRLFLVSSKSPFPQSCVNSVSSMVGLMATSFKNGLCHSQVCCTQSPCPCSRPLLTIGDTQTLKGRSGSVSVESHGLQKLLFEPSECLRWVWGLILNVILSLLLSCLGFSFALG